LVSKELFGSGSRKVESDLDRSDEFYPKTPENLTEPTNVGMNSLDFGNTTSETTTTLQNASKSLQKVQKVQKSQQNVSKSVQNSVKQISTKPPTKNQTKLKTTTNKLISPKLNFSNKNSVKTKPLLKPLNSKPLQILNSNSQTDDSGSEVEFVLSQEYKIPTITAKNVGGSSHLIGQAAGGQMSIQVNSQVGSHAASQVGSQLSSLDRNNQVPKKLITPIKHTSLLKPLSKTSRSLIHTSQVKLTKISKQQHDSLYEQNKQKD